MKQWRWKHINVKGFFGTRRFVKGQGVVDAETLGAAKRKAAQAVRKYDDRQWSDPWYNEKGVATMYANHYGSITISGLEKHNTAPTALTEDLTHVTL